MARCSEGPWPRAVIGAALAVLVALPRPAQAQGILERLGLDSMELASLGFAVGRVDPAQVEPAAVFAATADYGDIAPHWRIVFQASYWESRLSDAVVQRFLDTLRTSIVDPTDDYSLAASRVPLYDVTLSLGLRWSTSRTAFVRPYGSFGLGAHVINAEGRLIKGTFVERALDNIAAGFFAASGVEIRPIPRIVFDGQARADMVSGFRSFQLRAGVTYYLGPPRRPVR